MAEGGDAALAGAAEALGAAAGAEAPGAAAAPPAAAAEVPEGRLRSKAHFEPPAVSVRFADGGRAPEETPLGGGGAAAGRAPTLHPACAAVEGMRSRAHHEESVDIQRQLLSDAAGILDQLTAFNAVSEKRIPEMTARFTTHQRRLKTIAKDLGAITTILDDVRTRLVRLGATPPAPHDDDDD
eukprot:TRINITY_DN67344_c0_g1_i1.p1 TRINITY_DN67344_c0_g1~~TRINITY_DN67344_c0_g1_i1.p1  ORF type:complete len:214 (+),score=41.95 TRINITY_DN67344_c0_g1_i1:95-643(+)